MNLDIPSAETVREALAGLTLKQLEKLSELSGVPMTTIYKIRLGNTENPGIETVRQFAPHIAQAATDSVKAAA